MRHQDQVAAGRRLLHFLDTRTTAMAEGVYRNPVEDYTSPAQAAREAELFFRRGPINVGLSALLPRPGAYRVHDWLGVPILLLRDANGAVRAFLNVCRHRGARVAEGCGDAASFSCPYHGWTYGRDGALVSRPDDRSFAEVPKATRGLTPLPAAEKDGLVWVAASPGLALDPDAALGPLAAELAGYQFGNWHHYETRVLRPRINWKLAVDTFLESYHIGVLHMKTIAPILHTNLGTFDAFGPHLRLVMARRTIDGLRRLPESEWDLIPLSAVIYVVFPNTVLIVQGDHLETWHIFPAGNGVDESAMYISLYTPEPALTASARGHWDRNFDLLMATVEKEDFPLSEGIQRGFYAGAQSEVVFGRNEPALQHFHRSVKAALAAAG
jgi:phenylpropionate dioxygenase-like ring-hydroxylating dioxygenase large terminal subunit